MRVHPAACLLLAVSQPLAPPLSRLTAHVCVSRFCRRQRPLGGVALRLDPPLRGCRPPGAARPGHSRPVVALLGGLGRAAGGQVFRGDGGGVSGALGVLLRELFLGGGDDDGDRNGERGPEEAERILCGGCIHYVLGF